MRFSLATFATAALVLSASAAPHRGHGKGRNTTNTDADEQRGNDAGRGRYSDGNFPSGAFGSRGSAAPTGFPDFSGRPSRPNFTAAPTALPTPGADLESVSFELPSTTAEAAFGEVEARATKSKSSAKATPSSESGSSGGSNDEESGSGDDSSLGSSGSDSSSGDESSSGSGSGSGNEESSSGSGDQSSGSGSGDQSSGSGSGDEESSSGSGGSGEEESSTGSGDSSSGDSSSGSGSSGGSSNSTTPSTPSSGGSSASGSFPAAAGESTLSAPMEVTDFDGGMVKFGRGVSCTSGEGGDADAVFIVADGGSLSNVIIGADQIEGVHCAGACTITNVWWEAVCEDALSFKGNGDGTVSGGGAKGAKDKVVQHNGVGTVSISGFSVDDFGKLYRSCGNCKTVSFSICLLCMTQITDHPPARRTSRKDRQRHRLRRIFYPCRHQLQLR